MGRALKGLAAASAVLLLSAGTALAEDSGYAKGAAAYLDLVAGARAIAMGQARAALEPMDATALLANPGLMTFVPAHSLATNSGVLGIDRSLYFVGYLLPWTIRHEGWDFRQGSQSIYIALAGGLASFATKNIEGRSEFGQPQSNFENSEHAYYFSLGLQAIENFSVGFTGKILTQKLHAASADGNSFDVGAIYRLPQTRWGKFDLGFLVRDLSGALDWKLSDDNIGAEYSYSEPVTTKYVLGTAYSPNPKWSLALDFVKARDQNLKVHLGGEWKAYKGFWLRAGANAYDPTAGFGYAWDTRSAGISIDYAFQYSIDSLYNTHWFSVNLRFLAQKRDPAGIKAFSLDE